MHVTLKRINHNVLLKASGGTLFDKDPKASLLLRLPGIQELGICMREYTCANPEGHNFLEELRAAFSG